VHEDSEAKSNSSRTHKLKHHMQRAADLPDGQETEETVKRVQNGSLDGSRGNCNTQSNINSFGSADNDVHDEENQEIAKISQLGGDHSGYLACYIFSFSSQFQFPCFQPQVPFFSSVLIKRLPATFFHLFHPLLFIQRAPFRSHESIARGNSPSVVTRATTRLASFYHIFPFLSHQHARYFFTTPASTYHRLRTTQNFQLGGGSGLPCDPTHDHPSSDRLTPPGPRTDVIFCIATLKTHPDIIKTKQGVYDTLIKENGVFPVVQVQDNTGVSSTAIVPQLRGTPYFLYRR
jgi:hypothetical protein